MKFKSSDIQQLFKEFLEPAFKQLQSDYDFLRNRVDILEREPRVFTLKVGVEREKKPQ